MTASDSTGRHLEIYQVDVAHDIASGASSTATSAVQKLTALMNEVSVRDAAQQLEQHWFAGDPDAARDFVRSLIRRARIRYSSQIRTSDPSSSNGTHWRWGAPNDRGMNSLNSSTEPLVGAELTDAWAAIASRYHQLTTLLMQRHDAGAVLGPWIRHLVRCVDYSNSFDRDQRSRIAMMALQQVLEALPEGTSLELERASEPNAACLVARMLVNTRTGRGSTDWEEWQSLLLAEHDSLGSCASVGWQAAAEALLRAGDPHAAWLQTARVLQPIFRRRARCHPTDVDPVVHLVMPGMYASACLGQEGAALWSTAFELARRQFLVDRPPATDLEYRLCSYVFAACPRIFHEADVIERMLALLPTSAHVGWARDQLGGSTQA